MLSVMRRHSGWGLKVILSVVVVSFVFFFGYTSMLRDQHSSDSTALQIGKEAIPYSRYKFFYNNQYENFRQKFKDAEMPDFLTKSIQQNTERQVVQRTLTKQFAKSLGIDVSDKELATFIMKDEKFDPVEYKNFLQYFYRENGFSYETLMREDLLLQKFQEWGQKNETIAFPAAEEVQWTFETASLDGEDKRALAEKIQGLWAQGKEAGPDLKAAKVAAQKVGPIALQQRKQLFHGDLTMEEYQQLFSLKNHTGPAQPFQNGKHFLLARLIEKKLPIAKKDEPKTKDFYPKIRLLDLWFQDFIAKTNVKSLVQADKQ